MTREVKFREIIKLFSADLTAEQISFFSGLSRNCINRILKNTSSRIAEYCEKESYFDKGEIENEFAKTDEKVKNHINVIENFWGLAKVRLSKFRGMSKNTFYLHLKECEFRFNYRNEDLYKLILKILRNRPLKVS